MRSRENSIKSSNNLPFSNRGDDSTPKSIFKNQSIKAGNEQINNIDNKKSKDIE